MIEQKSVELNGISLSSAVNSADHEIKKYSPGYVMYEDCPPLLAGQKKYQSFINYALANYQ